MSARRPSRRRPSTAGRTARSGSSVPATSPGTSTASASRPRRAVRPSGPVPVDEAPAPVRRGSRPAIARADVVGRRSPSFRLLGLVLVLIVGVAVLLPTLRHAVEQQEELREVTAQVEEARLRTQDLERRTRLWQDPEYVRAQARDRLGYVMPGESTFVVLDPESVTGAEPMSAQDLAAQEARRRAATSPWYVQVWESVGAAGRGPAQESGEASGTAPSAIPPPPGTPEAITDPSSDWTTP